MILISHRGNTFGKEDKENQPEYILNTLKKGFNVEIDVWFYRNFFYLGHDEPLYKIDKKFLYNKKLWCHAKNSSAIYELSKTKAHFFWHQKDDYTLTSKGIIWVYPKKKFYKNSIIVLEKRKKKLPRNCLGVCSDYVGYFK